MKRDQKTNPEKFEEAHLTIKGIEEISLKTVKKVVNDTCRYTISMSLDLAELEADAVRQMMIGAKTWYVTIGVEAKQIPMDVTGFGDGLDD